jgi:predicted AAA+ superfamily ATPase
MLTPVRVHEQIGQWIQRSYMAQQPQEMVITLASASCCNVSALSYIPEQFAVGEGFVYSGFRKTHCDVITPITLYSDKKPGRYLGALIFTFVHPENDEQFEVLLVSAWDEHDNDITMACVPQSYSAQWLTFEDECNRIVNTAAAYRDRVYIVGGMARSFEATIEWEDIYLPADLKVALLNDVDSFFDQGVKIYRELNLKPFRKLLLAGVPGTGKTMLCGALARRALSQGHFVIYVSGSNIAGSEFWKIHQALEIASRANTPTIVIVEELDAYLKGDSKAQMLNVLDGSETPLNPQGTLLIATTNHPEQIDNRVMKRPGRLDRIFIIPELKSEEDARGMLKKYLGKAWRDEHVEIVPHLLGRPGAFVREVAVYALTMAAYQHLNELSLDILQESLDSLESQIEAKDNFLTMHKDRSMGLIPVRRNGSSKD